MKLQPTDELCCYSLQSASALMYQGFPQGSLGEVDTEAISQWALADGVGLLVAALIAYACCLLWEWKHAVCSRTHIVTAVWVCFSWLSGHGCCAGYQHLLGPALLPVSMVQCFTQYVVDFTKSMYPWYCCSCVCSMTCIMLLAAAP
jgi:hypothetical protein